MRKILSLICLLFSLPLCSLFLEGAAGESKKHGPVNHSLVADIHAWDGITSFWLAWKIEREEGWHTYWTHPGEVGLPPSVQWDLPEGVEAGPLVFPPPKRVMMGKVAAHGHHGETLFLSQISASDKFKPSGDLTIRGNISWLACSKTCLPGFSEIELSLPLEKTIREDKSWSAAFNTFREKLPQDPPVDWKASAHDEGGKFKLVVPVEEGAENPGIYFFGEGRSVRSNAMQPVREKNGMWELQMIRSPWSSNDESRLRGLLFRKDGWADNPAMKFYQIDLPLEK